MNLYNKVQKNNLESSYTMEEKAWMSDFQSENTDCPMHIRALIIETFKNKNVSKKKK